VSLREPETESSVDLNLSGPGIGDHGSVIREKSEVPTEFPTGDETQELKIEMSRRRVGPSRSIDLAEVLAHTEGNRQWQCSWHFKERAYLQGLHHWSEAMQAMSTEVFPCRIELRIHGVAGTARFIINSGEDRDSKGRLCPQ
jgi:hypothetical protein